MGFLKRLMAERLVFGLLIGGGLLAQPGVAGAWTFDQALGIWRDQPTPAVTSPNEAKPRPVLVQAKTKALQPTPMVERTPSNVEIVNKALIPGRRIPMFRCRAPTCLPAMSRRRPPAAVPEYMAAARIVARLCPS